MSLIQTYIHPTAQNADIKEIEQKKQNVKKRTQSELKIWINTNGLLLISRNTQRHFELKPRECFLLMCISTFPKRNAILMEINIESYENSYY